MSNKDLLALALVQHHIQSLEPAEQVRTYNLAERMRAMLNAEPDQDLAHTALALVNAERLIDL